MKKMKKLSRTACNRLTALALAFALACSLLFSLMPAASAADGAGTIFISSAEEFEELAQNCRLDSWSLGKKVVLQADISLTDFEVSAIPIFSGEFDGNGHTISGVQITRSAAPSGLFGILQEGAVIRNLKVSGSVIPSGDGSTVGGIAGENYGTILNCTFSGSVAGSVQVGGIAGINAASGQILSCSANGSVTGDKMTGGIAGCNLGVISLCRNDAYVNTVSTDPSLSPDDIQVNFSGDLSRLSTMDTSITASDTGGIAGYSSGILSGCRNAAPIGYPHIGYNVGGIAGRSCGSIHDCENDAEIFGRKDVGGIAGQMEPYIARNITESTLSRLEQQLDALDTLVNRALEDANSGVGTLSARLSRIADYTDSAAGAAQDIRTNGSVTGSASGSGESGGSGSITVTPPRMEADGSAEASGGAGVSLSPEGGQAGSGSSASGSIQAGLTEGGVSGQGSTSREGGLSASAQIAVTTNLGGLSSAVSGMSGQIRLLSGELSGTSGTLTGDIRAIQEQIRAISDTVMELFQGDGEGDILIDSSEIDVELVTAGKVSGSRNSAAVQGDINVGGITGSMAMEYELDPEDDIASGLNGSQRKKLEVRAIIQQCVNTGSVTAKRSYAGGICGRMDLGLVTRAENYGAVSSESGDYVGGIAGLTASTVRQSFSKCSLSGGKYVGGIVGSGVTEDLDGSSSTVAGCCSMVEIRNDPEYAGAVSGADGGLFTENVFVSDSLTGINGRSYTGRAEPISYVELLQRAETAEAAAPEDASSEEGDDSSGEGQEGETTQAKAEAAPVPVPDAFLQLELTFMAEDQVLKTVSFDYGDSFDQSVFPELPEKEGYYGCWDRTDLTDLHFDTVVTAVYTPYVTALSNPDTRSDGRPIFFMEGQFDDEAAVEASALPSTPEEFDGLADGWGDFLLQGLSGGTVSRKIVEQWRISIPDDGQQTHTVRYLSPDTDPEQLDIYVKESDSWEKAEADVIGSYLAFPVGGAGAEIAVISTTNAWWVRLIAGLLLLGLLATALLLISRLIRNRKPKPVRGEAQEDEEELPPFRPTHGRRRKRWLTPLLTVLALLAGIGGTAAFFLLPDLISGVRAYDILKTYTDRSELSMELTVDVQADGKDLSFSAQIDRTDLEGHRITTVSREDMALYYCDGVVFLENGNAYRLSDSHPDYTRLLELALALYQNTDLKEQDGVYTLTAAGTDAENLLKLLLPSLSDTPAKADTLQVEMNTEDDTFSALHFSGSGVLGDGQKTPFRLSAVLKADPDDHTRSRIPEAVQTAVLDGEYETAGEITDDLIRLAKAFSALQQDEATGALLQLKADCGPVRLEQQLDYCCWRNGEAQISSIRKDGYALYFTDTAICTEKGKAVSRDSAGIEAAELPGIACRICLSGSPSCSEADGVYTYTLSLDEEAMREIACAIAPAAAEMDLLFDSGSIGAVICGDRLQSVDIRCGGTVRVVLSSADMSFEVRMEFGRETDGTVPEAVREALTS